MIREPNGKPRAAGDITRQMVERLKAQHRPVPTPNAPPPPPSHHDPKENEP